VGSGVVRGEVHRDMHQWYIVSRLSSPSDINKVKISLSLYQGIFKSLVLSKITA